MPLSYSKKVSKMEKNNCYECPMRGEVAGSAHSSCSLLGNPKVNILTSIAVSVGKVQAIVMDEVPVIKFNAHGAQNGWCFWPVNFDPVWVDCTVDMEKIKMLHEQRNSNDRSINQ